MAGYDHQAIESRWQAYWEENATFRTSGDRSRKKFYILDMFPYPSGVGLHVGHPKGYVATDVVARIKRMQGYNVLRPMGWDSFGLPAERQAVREGISPREVTSRNIRTFKKQLQSLGLAYDWEREFATSDPDCYKWTQWIFLKLMKKGLAYEAEVPVNWCPALGTVLANEEVRDGVYVETGDPVEKRRMRQWMLKITDYAESLLAGLDGLDWPEGIKEMQRHWIGRSQGADIQFQIEGRDESITVFTTRPDTLYGCTYLVLAPEHELVSQICSREATAAVTEYCRRAAVKSERERMSEALDAEKTGVPTGAFARNPVNNQLVPIWISDYVLASYGKGAVFACPAHDERDHAFARRFSLPILEVVKGGDVAEAAWTGDGEHVQSGFLNGLNTADAKRKIISWLEAEGRGRGTVTYRLRDWLFSRQRYWGEPVPVIHVQGKVKPVPESDLPVTLPELQDYRAAEDGQPPLARATAWVQTRDPETGEAARRETNTMPQWAGSCWYYLRYISAKRHDVAWDPADERYWMPVDLYVGGAEHATLHLLYARFWHHVLHDLGLVSTREPFQRLYNQGMVHSLSLRDERGKYYTRDEASEQDGNWFAKDGSRLLARREKMSKSKFNVVSPEDMCREYGADSLRLYELFMGPLEDGGDWETSGVAGCRRFLDRVWRLANEGKKLTTETLQAKEVERALHLAIRRVQQAAESLKFNTAISDLMVFVNEATKREQIQLDWFQDFLIILAPFAPHLAEEIWQQLGHTESISSAPFPEYDEARIQQASMTIAVQVNGKLRARIEVPTECPQESILQAARAEENVQRFMQDKTLRKEIYVPGRLVNLVVG